MKAIMISVKPEWCRKILNGEKKIEIRKTMPKCELPVKVYIYCTKIKDKKRYSDEIDIPLETEMYMGNGRVIAEFTLDDIGVFCVFENGSVQGWNWFGLERSCLTYEQIAEYIGLNKKGYAWHIDDLKIYDEPKELSKFYKWGNCPHYYSDYEDGCCAENCPFYDKDFCNGHSLRVERPPQSWFYCEELEEK